MYLYISQRGMGRKRDFIQNTLVFVCYATYKNKIATKKTAFLKQKKHKPACCLKFRFLFHKKAWRSRHQNQTVLLKAVYIFIFLFYCFIYGPFCLIISFSYREH
jgi:hypothetical protein